MHGRLAIHGLLSFSLDHGRVRGQIKLCAVHGKRSLGPVQEHPMNSAASSKTAYQEPHSLVMMPACLKVCVWPCECYEYAPGINDEGDHGIAENYNLKLKGYHHL